VRAQVRLSAARVQFSFNFHKSLDAVNDTAVACTVVSLTLLCTFDTAVQGDLIFDRLWLPLKGISIKKKFIQKANCPTLHL
jgi:hypothetical protein